MDRLAQSDLKYLSSSQLYFNEAEERTKDMKKAQKSKINKEEIKKEKETVDNRQ